MSSFFKKKKKSYRPLPNVVDDNDGAQESNSDISDQEQNEIHVVFFMKEKPDKRPQLNTTLRNYPSSMCLAICFIAIVATLAIISYAIYALAAERIQPANNGSSINDSAIVPANIHWKFEVNGGLSELSLLIHDVNSDGIPDVIVDNVTSKISRVSYDLCPGKPDKCMETLGFTPCHVRLMALSGNDGSIVWSKWLPFGAYAANCKADFNGDGYNDCLFAGRSGGFGAYDVHNDVHLWNIDPNVTCPAYNYYYPLIIKDVNGDNIKDIIVTHGGDSLYQDEERRRTPGFLVAVSGLTGQQLSEHILTPDNKETYSSPILYKLPDGTELILFGSGGETITGSLWAISLTSLSDHVTKFNQNIDSYKINKDYIPRSCLNNTESMKIRPLPQADSYDTNNIDDWMKGCPQLSNTNVIWNKYHLCVYEFIPTGNKSGTMLPPVVVDLNNDQVMDLVVSQFNDQTMLYDGSTSKIVWDHYQPDTQTYSIPAPMYFNDDNVLDLVMRFSKGSWNHYSYSFIKILDGTSGKDILWSLNCSGIAMSSPVVLRNKKKGHDGVLFIGVGCEQNKLNTTGFKYNTRSVDTCPQRSLKFERKSCSANEDNLAKRHEGGNDKEPDDGYITDDIVIPVSAPEGLILSSSDIDELIPHDLWEAKSNSDKFPDPLIYPDKFMTEYCGLDIESLSANLYFFTPKVARDVIKPLITFQPYVHKPSYFPKTRDKRHSSQSSYHLGFLKTYLRKNRKAVRCAHILTPWYSPSTPAIADLNGDGKFEIIVSMGFSQAFTKPLIPPELSDIIHPQKVVTHAFTIQDKIEEVYGSTVVNKIDFSSYYPIDKQPWTQYMGTQDFRTYTHQHILELTNHSNNFKLFK